MLEAFISVIGVGLLGVIGWAFTLNSRVAVLEADKGAMARLLDIQFEDIKNRLVRIETMLDNQKHGAE